MKKYYAAVLSLVLGLAGVAAHAQKDPMVGARRCIPPRTSSKTP